MIGDSSGLFPHFLGVLSRTPTSAHMGGGQGGGPQVAGTGDEEAGIPHPFNPRMPVLQRDPHRGNFGGRPPMQPGPMPMPARFGGPVFGDM